jgi:hypothetical protein
MYEHNPFVIEASLTNPYLSKFKDDLADMNPSDGMLVMVVCCAFLHKRLSPRKNINLSDQQQNDNSGFNNVIYAMVKTCERGTVVRGEKYLNAFLTYMRSVSSPKLADLQGKLPQGQVRSGHFQILFHQKHKLKNPEEDEVKAKDLFKRWMMCGWCLALRISTILPSPR